MPTRRTRLTQPFLASLLLAAFHTSAAAADSVSVEFASGSQTDIARVGAQWKWPQRWWQSNGTHLGAYWDLSVARWRGKRFENAGGGDQRLTDIGLTPVLRLQNDSLRGFYAEAGIGAHYLSDLYDNNDRQLSTRFQFGDHLGFGYVFRNGLDAGLRIQHFSNGGIKHPNDGVNVAVIRLSYPLD